MGRFRASPNSCRFPALDISFLCPGSWVGSGRGSHSMSPCTWARSSPCSGISALNGSRWSKRVSEFWLAGGMDPTNDSFFGSWLLPSPAASRVSRPKITSKHSCEVPRSSRPRSSGSLSRWPPPNERGGAPRRSKTFRGPTPSPLAWLRRWPSFRGCRGRESPSPPPCFGV